jgi:hypothetical protein
MAAFEKRKMRGYKRMKNYIKYIWVGDKRIWRGLGDDVFIRALFAIERTETAAIMCGMLQM